MKNHEKFWHKLIAFAIVSALLLSSFTIVRAQPLAYEQLPGHFGGFLSDGPGFVVADEFQFSQSALIENITWWGGYGSPHLPIPSSDNFTIRLYSDNGGEPGTILNSYDVGDNASRTATGDFVNPPDPPFGFVGRPEFKYSFDLPVAVSVDANTFYWLSIINEPGSDIWLWEASGSLTHLGVQRSFSGGPWEPYFDNTAFQINVTEDTPILPITMDIKPGSSPNSINVLNTGVIPVAILSSDTFYAPSQVDRTSLTFGRTGDETSLANCATKLQDVNSDSLVDLVCTFHIQATGFQLGDITGTLKGKTVTGLPLGGTDRVHIVSK